MQDLPRETKTHEEAMACRARVRVRDLRPGGLGAGAALPAVPAGRSWTLVAAQRPGLGHGGLRSLDGDVRGAHDLRDGWQRDLVLRLHARVLSRGLLGTQRQLPGT